MCRRCERTVIAWQSDGDDNWKTDLQNKCEPETETENVTFIAPTGREFCAAKLTPGQWAISINRLGRVKILFLDL